MYKVKGIDLSISEQTGKENKETYHAISIKLNAKYLKKHSSREFQTTGVVNVAHENN